MSLLKEDINRISRMSDEDIDSYLESDNYNKLSEEDKLSVLRLISSNIEFNEDKTFEEFAEEVSVQERIFNRELKLNENNIRKVRKEFKG